MVVPEGRQRNYGFVNKGKEKFTEFQNLKIPISSGNLCDLSNDLLRKETAGFGVEVTPVINGIIRALALGNANAKSKENLAFLSPNPSASENGIQHYCKFFCNTATVQF